MGNFPWFEVGLDWQTAIRLLSVGCSNLLPYFIMVKEIVIHQNHD